MANSTFVYVTYIGATPKRLWSALTDADAMRKYWFGMYCESDWTTGSLWKLMSGEGQILSTGEILEAEMPTRLAIRWRHRSNPERELEGDSFCTFELEPLGTAVKLCIVHTIECEPSKMIAAASSSWPKIISNLKSLLETGSIVLQSAD